VGVGSRAGLPGWEREQVGTGVQDTKPGWQRGHVCLQTALTPVPGVEMAGRQPSDNTSGLDK
jgi:hypothetical protein